MKLKHYAFKLYWLALRLYPKRFRDSYSEEMLLVAYEVLQVPHGAMDTLQVAFRLGLDLCITAAKERGKQLALVPNMARLGRVTLAVLQILGMLAVTYFVILPILSVYVVATYLPYWQQILAVIPACMILLVFVLLRHTPGLSLWVRLRWAYLIGFSGAITLTALSIMDEWIAPPALPQALHLGNEGIVLFAYERDFVLAAIVSLLLYVITLKIRRRLIVAV